MVTVAIHPYTEVISRIWKSLDLNGSQRFRSMTARIAKFAVIMPDEENAVCEMCLNRKATHHICYGGTGGTKHLCPTCYEQAALPEQLLLDQKIRDAIANGRCKYCGEPATGGGGGLGSIRGQHFTLWCERCRQDLVEFHTRPENEITAGFPFEDRTAQRRLMQEIAERDLLQEEFMKQKILARRRES
jgi:hypothetical protein